MAIYKETPEGLVLLDSDGTKDDIRKAVEPTFEVENVPMPSCEKEVQNTLKKVKKNAD